jgi:hypothetical protein
MTNNMLNAEEREHKDEIIKLTEDVLDARGIECDSRISRLPLDELEEILEEVRRRYKKKNKRTMTEKSSSSSNTEEEVVEEEIQYIR